MRIFFFFNLFFIPVLNSRSDDRKHFYDLINHIAYNKIVMDIVRQHNKSIYDKDISRFLKSKRHLIYERIPYTRTYLLSFMKSFPNKNRFLDHMIKFAPWILGM